MLRPKLLRFPVMLAGAAVMALLAGCAGEHGPVMASPCPAWVDYPADLHSNDGSSYLGCVNQANLEQMLADKHDLEQGRTLAPADGERQAKAISDYKAGKTKTSSGAGTTGSAVLLQGSGAGNGATGQ